MQQRAPYKYLDYYTFADADLFFGREEETQKMVGEILSTRLLVLFSPSGSGKTSLINAGVRPALEKLGYQTVYVRLDKDPIPSVQSAVAAAVALSNNENSGHPESRKRDEESLSTPTHQQISRPESGTRNDSDEVSQNDLHSFFKNVTRKTEKPLVVFIDQFEEFFIVFENKLQLRQQFIEQVAKIKYDDQLPVFLVLSLREDYFANLHEFREAIPSIFQNNANIRLEPFTEAEARRAIEEPMKVVGCEFEAGLVDRILEDLKNGKSSIEPITLQIVCNTVWEEKSAQAQRITFADYKAAGGADHILSNYVSCFLDNLSARQQSLMAKIFVALKTPDDTKRYRTFEDLQATLKLRPSRLKRGLDQLVAFNLLRQETRAGTNWYEFKHDYLVGEVTQWIQARKERINKNRFIFGLSPGIFLLLGLLAYCFYQFNTFYASFTNREYPKQLEEIFISRGIPFGSITKQKSLKGIITTGYFKQDLRKFSMVDALTGGYKVGFWKKNDWGWMAENLKIVQSGIFLYRIGQFDAGLDTLVTALKDDYYYFYDIGGKAENALVNLGKSDDRVILALIAALKDNASRIRVAAATTLVKLGHGDELIISVLVTALNYQETTVRLSAADALGHLGHNDNRIIVALVSALKDEDYNVRSHAANALVNLGKSNDRVQADKVLSAFVAELKDQETNVRLLVVDALENLGRSNDRIQADKAISALIAALQDQESSVRLRAANALVHLGHSNGRVIAVLVTALKDQVTHIRLRAAEVLQILGHDNARVISALVDALKDQEINVRVEAAAAVGNFGHNHDRAIAVLVTALKYKDSSIRERAAEALRNFHQNDDRILAMLITALIDESQYVREQAAHTLVDLGQSNEHVISALVAALRDEREYLSGRAADVLEKLGQSDGRVITALIAALKNEDDKVRSRAATVLGNLGYSSNDSAIAALVFALEDENQDVRSKAAAALGNIGYRNDHIIAALNAAFKNENQNVRYQAAIALGNLGYCDERILAELLTALNYEIFRSQTVILLGKLGYNNDRVIIALVTALKDKDDNVRMEAATALGNLGTRNNLAISALVAALEDENDSVRSQATAALGSLGQNNDRVISALGAALRDESENVRAGAATALAQLLQPKTNEKLVQFLTHNLSGYRTVAARTLAAQNEALTKTTLEEIDQLRNNDKRPWARLGAWEAYDLIQQRMKSEKEAAQMTRKADSLFAISNYPDAKDEYDSAFDILKDIIRVDSAKIAYAKFQQARCEAKLMRKDAALSDLKVAVQYQESWRDTLQAEMAKPENDWKILAGNWYLREVLLKR